MEMLGKFGDMGAAFQKMQMLLQDQNFRNFMTHPKVQESFKDPELQEVMKSKDFQKILTHPKFSQLMQDPDVALLISKLDMKKLMG